MARSERLLMLLEALRRHRRPVSGQTLAEETGVSLRTLYRDIASLQELGVTVEGEAGVGYVLRPGFLLPPLSFAEEELEALMLGMRWVAREGDARLGDAALAVCRKSLRYCPKPSARSSRRLASSWRHGRSPRRRALTSAFCAPRSGQRYGRQSPIAMRPAP